MNADEYPSRESVAGRCYRVPSPLVEEGQGEGSLGLAEFADRRQDSGEILSDLLIRDAPHAKSPCPEPRVAPRVIGVVQIMRLAVNFDDRMSLEADEVGDERNDRILPTKLVPTRAPVAQLRPQQSFRPCRPLPQVARAF